MKWLVELQYETLAGKSELRKYTVKAKNAQAAVGIAKHKIAYLKDYKKINGGSATPLTEEQLQ